MKIVKGKLIKVIEDDGSCVEELTLCTGIDKEDLIRINEGIREVKNGRELIGFISFFGIKRVIEMAKISKDKKRILNMFLE